MITIVKQAKAAHLIKTVVELKEHLVDVDGVNHFEEECERDLMGLLRGHLVKKHVEVNDSHNGLHSFQIWLDSNKPNKEEKKDFAFLRSVRPSPAFVEKRLKELFESGNSRTIALMVKRKLARKEVARREEIERAQLEIFQRKLEEKRRKAVERAMKKKQKEKDKMEHLANGAPSLVPMSNPPTYNSPSVEWKHHMNNTFIHIRNIVDHLCMTHNVEAPSFVGTAVCDAFEPMKIVGKAAQMFIDCDLVDMETATAQMKTWLPAPWRKSFQVYLNSFHEVLTSTAIPGASSRHLTTLVDSYMAKNFKPVASRGKFQTLIEAIRDGQEEFSDNSDDDDDDDAAAAAADNDADADVVDPILEGELADTSANAMADLEETIDLNDTTASAAMLSALRA